MSKYIFFIALLSIIINAIAAFFIIKKNSSCNVSEGYQNTQLLNSGIKADVNEKIPKKLMMTIPDKSKIPQKVFDMLDKYCIDVNEQKIPYVIYNNDQCIEFLQKNYRPSVLSAFKGLRGAHKADLFRYCYLYLHGGIYLDIKTKLIKPIHKIVDLNSTNRMYTVIGARDQAPKPQIYQGIIFTPPGNKIFLELVKHCVDIGNSIFGKAAAKISYHIFVIHMYTVLKKYHNNKKLVQGLNRLDNIDCYLFQEVIIKPCQDKDRYGLCAEVHDNGEKIIDTRWKDYPWK